MKDILLDCKDELKKAEHLVFVSMKYSRTVDVIRSILKRLVRVYELVIDALLKYKLDSGEEFEIPRTYGLKTQLIRKYFADDERIMDELEFYFFLKKLLRAEFEANNEFRRHVHMKLFIDGKEKNIDYDTVLEYYKRAVNFFDYLVKTYLKMDFLTEY